jgi:hypothetical protein
MCQNFFRLFWLTYMCIKCCGFVNEEFPTEIQKLAKKQQVLNYAKYSNFIYMVLPTVFFSINYLVLLRQFLIQLILRLYNSQHLI